MADNEEDEEVRKYIRRIIKEEREKDIPFNTGGSDNAGELNLTELAKLANTAKAFKEAFSSEVDKAISKNVSEKIVQQVIPGILNPPEAKGRSFLDSGFMISLGQKIPDTIPSLIDVLVKNFGKDRTYNMVDGLQKRFLSGEGGGEESGSKIKQNEDDFILSLDADNPADLHKFMAMSGIQDANDAKKQINKMKQEIFDKIRTGEGGQGESSGSGNLGVLEKEIKNQNELMKQLVNFVQQDRELIHGLANEIAFLKQRKESVQPVQDVSTNVMKESSEKDILKDSENTTENRELKLEKLKKKWNNEEVIKHKPEIIESKNIKVEKEEKKVSDVNEEEVKEVITVSKKVKSEPEFE